MIEGLRFRLRTQLQYWWLWGRFLPRSPRWINWLWTRVAQLFWLPCPKCGEYFGGHERGPTVFEYLGSERGTFKMICYRHGKRSPP